MKRALCILIMAMAVVALSAYGLSGQEADTQIQPAENSGSKAESSVTAKKEIEGDFYKFSLSKDFTEQESEDEDIREWHSSIENETSNENLPDDIIQKR